LSNRMSLARLRFPYYVLASGPKARIYRSEKQFREALGSTHNAIYAVLPTEDLASSFLDEYRTMPTAVDDFRNSYPNGMRHPWAKNLLPHKYKPKVQEEIDLENIDLDKIDFVPGMSAGQYDILGRKKDYRNQPLRLGKKRTYFS